MNVIEDKVNGWAKALSDTEETRCTNAISAITETLKERFGNSITIIHQGSHRNNTNIRADSDVDIAVVYEDVYFSDTELLSLAASTAHFQTVIPATYTFNQFKTDVHDTLVKKFGISTQRKNKCILVQGNTYRVQADVVPAFESRKINAPGFYNHVGIGFIPDDGTSVRHSYPIQHYDSGVEKNSITAKAYKAVVRILKNARNDMVEKRLIEKNSMPSFFLECLVWNAPVTCFSNKTYREDALSVAYLVWSQMRDLSHKNYTEVCKINSLFRESHRTPAQAEAFMAHVWHYLQP